MGYALYKDGKRIGKNHSTKLTAEMEAYDRTGVMYIAESGNILVSGYEIREEPENAAGQRKTRCP